MALNTTQYIIFNHCHIYLNTVQTPVVSIASTTATTISLFWMSSGTVIESYDVMWEGDNTGKGPAEDEGSITITNDTASYSYTITGLEEDSYYKVTVTATNAAESAVSDPVTGLTEEAGKGAADTIVITSLMSKYTCILSFRSISPSYPCWCNECDLFQHHRPVGGSGLHSPQWVHNRLLSTVHSVGEWEYTDTECLGR